MNENNASNLERIGDSLSTLKGPILERWEELIREEITSSGGQSQAILQNHMPEIFDGLAEALSIENWSSKQGGSAHGFQRAVMTDYRLEEIFREISLLRSVLIDYLYPLGDLRATKVLHGYIDEIIQQSVGEFLKTTRLRPKT